MSSVVGAVASAKKSKRPLTLHKALMAGVFSSVTRRGSDSLIGSNWTESYLWDVPKTQLLLPMRRARARTSAARTHRAVVPSQWFRRGSTRVNGRDRRPGQTRRRSPRPAQIRSPGDAVACVSGLTDPAAFCHTQRARPSVNVGEGALPDQALDIGTQEERESTQLGLAANGSQNPL